MVIPPNTDIILNQLFEHRGLPWGLSSKESVCNAGDMGSIPRSGGSPGEGNGNLVPVFLPGKSDGQRSLVGYSPWGLQTAGLDLVTKPPPSI